MNDRLSWRHYFCDLPMFALGIPPLRIRSWDRVTGERDHVIHGVEYLRERLGKRFCPLPTAEIVRNAHWVKLVRESDIYTCLVMSRKNLNRFFRIDGLEHVERAFAENRPVALLGGHLGSNYTMWIALGLLGYRVFPIARAVDRSNATPASRQAYMTLLYGLTSRKWPGRYLYADSTGHLARGFFHRILEWVYGQKGILFVAIDIPPALYLGKQESVMFLGGEGRLPVALIRAGIRRQIQMLTVWDCVELSENRVIRRIRLGPPLSGGNEKEMLQDYADRFTDLICREPWQWMGLPIAHQYHE